jgi:peroxiredoxin
MIARAAFAVMTIAALAGCASRSATSPTTATWDRPGLEGSVRPEWGSPREGEQAPDLDLPNAHGESTHLSSLRGQWVLLHFTAAWCPYCDSEIDQLGVIATAYRQKNLRVVLVDVRDPDSVWNPYRQARVSPDIVALHDADGSETARFAPTKAHLDLLDRWQVPLDATLILDPQGKIRLFLLPDSAHFDPTFRAVEREIDRLLAGGAARADAPPQEEVPAPRSTADVVTISFASSGCAMTAKLAIAAGYHIMSDRPSEPNYIATRVDFWIDGRPAAPSSYPSPIAYAVGDRSISTFQGDVIVSTTLDVATCDRAQHRVEARVTYQACTAAKCLLPVHRTISAKIALTR